MTDRELEEWITGMIDRMQAVAGDMQDGEARAYYSGKADAGKEILRMLKGETDD